MFEFLLVPGESNANDSKESRHSKGVNVNAAMLAPEAGCGRFLRFCCGRCAALDYAMAGFRNGAVEFGSLKVRTFASRFW